MDYSYNDSMGEKIKNTEREQSLEERFKLNPADFPLLSRQENAEGKQMSIDQTAEKYVSSTAQLIAEIDGSSEDMEADKKPDYVIYLDKSARPVSWFVNVFWDTLAQRDPENPEKPVKRPPHSFLNIDRVNWFRRIGKEIDVAGNGRRDDGSFGRLGWSDFEPDRVSREDLASIRALFIKDGIETEDATKIFEQATVLDGKNLLIVDEVKNSGSTLSIAMFLLKSAIPELKSVDGAYFWQDGGTRMVGDEIQMGSVPVWYDARTPYGRGIGDVNEAYHAEVYQQFPNAKTRARKMGAFVIGSPIGVDEKARELTREIKKLESEYREGHILFAPPLNYSFERTVQELNRQGFYQDQNGRFSTYADFRAKRQ